MTNKQRAEPLARLYGQGVTGRLMNPRFTDDKGHPKPKVEKLLQRLHKPNGSVNEDRVYSQSVNGRVHSWKVPYGLLYYWRKPLRRHQMVIYHPWYVTWVSPKTGKRLRKMFQNLPTAIHFVATRAQYVDKSAAVVSKQNYDVPPALRGKFPHRDSRGVWYWCPLCVTPRRFHRTDQTTTVMKKIRRDDGTFKWTARTVAVIQCRVCGCTNRNSAFRRSNQPWEKRKFKRGVRRAKRRRR